MGETKAESSNRSRSSAPTRTNSPSAATEQHMVPFTMKAKAPIIGFSVTPRCSERIDRIRSATFSS